MRKVDGSIIVRKYLCARLIEKYSWLLPAQNRLQICLTNNKQLTFNLTSLLHGWMEMSVAIIIF